MCLFAGLSFSDDGMLICVVSEEGIRLRVRTVKPEPEAVISALQMPGYDYQKIGLQIHWHHNFHRLQSSLVAAGFPVVSIATSHRLARRPSKEPKNALDIAEVLRKRHLETTAQEPQVDYIPNFKVASPNAYKWAYGVLEEFLPEEEFNNLDDKGWYDITIRMQQALISAGLLVPAEPKMPTD